jgi:hypothetical protein
MAATVPRTSTIDNSREKIRARQCAISSKPCIKLFLAAHPEEDPVRPMFS